MFLTQSHYVAQTGFGLTMQQDNPVSPFPGLGLQALSLCLALEIVPCN